MWQEHKALIGENCPDSCTCVLQIPHLISGFLESVDHRTVKPLGFMTNFARRFAGGIKEQHPTESSAKLVERLLDLWRTEPSLRAIVEASSSTSAGDNAARSTETQKVPRKRQWKSDTGVVTTATFLFNETQDPVSKANDVVASWPQNKRSKTSKSSTARKQLAPPLQQGDLSRELSSAPASMRRNNRSEPCGTDKGIISVDTKGKGRKSGLSQETAATRKLEIVEVSSEDTFQGGIDHVAETNIPVEPANPIATGEVDDEATTSTSSFFSKAIFSNLKRGSGPKCERRVQWKQTATGELSIETKTFLSLEDSEKIDASARNAPQRPSYRTSDVAKALRDGSAVDVIEVLGGGGASNLSRESLHEMKRKIHATKNDPESGKKRKALDLYLLSEEVISLLQRPHTSSSLVMAVDEVVNIQGKALEPDATLQVGVTEKLDASWRKYTESTALLASRVVFPDAMTFTINYNEEKDEAKERARKLVLRLKSLRNVKGDKRLFLGVAEILLDDAKKCCLDIDADSWGKVHAEVIPHKYKFGCYVENGARVICRVKNEMLERAKNKIVNVINELSQLEQQLETKLSGNILVAKSSLLHAAVEILDKDLVKELLRLGANPSQHSARHGSAQQFVETIANRLRLESIDKSQDSEWRREKIARVEEIVKLLREGCHESQVCGSTDIASVGQTIQLARKSSDSLDSVQPLEPFHGSAHPLDDQLQANGHTNELQLPLLGSRKLWIIAPGWERRVCDFGYKCGRSTCCFIHILRTGKSLPHHLSLASVGLESQFKILAESDSLGKRWYTAGYTTAVGRRVLNQIIVFAEEGLGSFQSSEGVWWYETEAGAKAGLETTLQAVLQTQSEHIARILKSGHIYGMCGLAASTRDVRRDGQALKWSPPKGSSEAADTVDGSEPRSTFPKRRKLNEPR